jgi:hypothetical protein
VTGFTHEILGLCPLLDRVVGYKVDKNLNLRLGKWRIPDGKVESGLRSDSNLLDGSPRPC